MKTPIGTLSVAVASAAAFSLLTFLAPPSAYAQGTGFTYQGFLTDGGGPYTGNAEFQASLWNAASGGVALASNTPTQVIVGVTNGLFVLPLDFGANFPGAARWLQLEVRTTIGPFNTLAPRQPLSPAPYAITANNLSGTLPAAQLSGVIPSAGLAGTYSGAVTLSNSANSFSGNGAGLTNLNAGQLTAGTVPDARLAASVARTNQVWLLGGNAGTTPGTHFLGTTDNQALEFRVNGLRVFRIEDNGDGSDVAPTPDGAPNVIAGSSGNSVGSNVVGATISGGGATSYENSPHNNVVLSDYATVGGGLKNSVASGADYSAIAGGRNHTIGNGANDSVISGGFTHSIGSNSLSATIGGGGNNTIGSGSRRSTIGGGNANSIGNTSKGGTVGGGEFNSVSDSSTNCVIAGGYSNEIHTNANGSSIGGGLQNTIQSGAGSSFIGGGQYNLVETNAYLATIGGGDRNNIQMGAGDSTIGGGVGNAILAGAFASTIGGGADNRVGDEYATVAGGRANFATGNFSFAAGGYQNYGVGEYSFAAGRQAKANHMGAFVWADSTGFDFASTAGNQFLLRASGGVGIGLNNPAAQLEISSSGGDSFPQVRINQSNTNEYARLRFTVGGDVSKRWDFAARSNVFVIYSGLTGSEALRLENNNAYVNGALVTTSDRNAKEDFASVSPGAVLEKVAALPLHEWTYRTDAARSRHLGPMAQDFRAAFGLGTDDKHIATVDADGVALAAIQGLNQKVDSENAALRADNVELKRRLEALEKLLRAPGGSKDKAER